MGKESTPIRNPDLSRSQEVGSLHFPTRTDYEQYFMLQGRIPTPDALWNDDNLVRNVQRHWHTRGQTGCIFAQIAATKAEEVGWRSEVVKRNLQEYGIATSIDTLVTEGIQDPHVQNLSLLFPQARTNADLRALLAGITTGSQVFKAITTRYEEYDIVALRAKLREGVLSWVVGFGPFDFLPLSRRSPVTELAIRTKEKPDTLFHKLNKDKSAAHLADIPLGLDGDLMEFLLEATKERTQLILQDIPRELAAAKITFAIPAVSEKQI